MGVEQKVFEYANKKYAQATSQIEQASVKKQCKMFLATSKYQRLVHFKLRDVLLTGMATDYKNENDGGKISVEDWLKPYHAEPLFEKVLSKSKVTWAELEAKLRE